jgi:gluconate 2-dehydrogenase gamma chain
MSRPGRGPTRSTSHRATPGEEPSMISRRDMLRTTGAAGAAALLPPSADALEAPSASPAPKAEPSKPPAGPMMNLTAAETELLSAMVDRLIPSDELGPGALEAGVLRFIDRALSEADSDAVESYRAGLAALDRYSRYTRRAPFLELSARDRDSVLLDLQTGGATGAGVGFQGSSGSFFNLVKSHTWQGMFGDPQYGGNVGYAGWDLLQYPGVRMRVSPEEQRRLEADELPDIRQSAYDYETFRTEDRE